VTVFTMPSSKCAGDGDDILQSCSHDEYPFPLYKTENNNYTRINDLNSQQVVRGFILGFPARLFVKTFLIL
jgi:hypothetical protein